MHKILFTYKKEKTAVLAILILLLGFVSATVLAADFTPGDPPLPPSSIIPPANTGTALQPQTSVAAATQYIYLPLIQLSRSGLFVNPQNRQDSVNFYLQQYLTSEGVAVNWTGDLGSCNPGTTGQAFQQAVLRRINYFRAMAGVPAQVTFSDESNLKAQAAALMMSVNRQLSHSPPSNWTCYSTNGAEGAGSSNLYLGVYSWSAITGYMKDPGSGNNFAGHRRWILYPQTQVMGTGDIPPTQNYPPANALRVFDSHMWEARPVTREEFVAWPPPGYVPYQVVFPRWSFSYANADFSGASVSMELNGSALSINQAAVANGYGENTLVWIPLGLNDGASWPFSGADTTYTVVIHNVVIAGQSRDFTYQVIVFNPVP